MTTVLLIGGAEDSEIESLITGTLAASYQITYIKNNAVSRFGNGYEILVIDAEYISEISLSECIIVMKSNGVLPDISLPERSIVIADSENKKLIDTLVRLGAHTITCGSKAHNSVSYSSLTSDGVVISLNREIVAFSGRKIEPLEIPAFFTTDTECVYNSLAFTALRLVLDDCNSEIGLLY